MANESISKAGELISGTITNAAKGVGTTISTISDASGLDKIQLAPGLDVEGFANSLKSAPDTGVGATLGKITGLDVSQVLQVPSRAKIKNLIGSYLGGLQEQIALEVRRCIENHLLALLNKIPEINLVLNIEQIITNAIAGERIKIQRKIALDVNKLAFQKLKVQQIALYKQKITEAVRKACPSTSPRNIKLYQGNSLEIIKAAAAVASKTATEIQEDAEKQAEGFNEDTSEKLTQTPEPEVQKQLGTTVREQPKVEEVLKEEEKIQPAVKTDSPIQLSKPVDPVRPLLNRLRKLVKEKSILYREYMRKQYTIVHNIPDSEYTDIIFTYAIPLNYGTWNTNNPGWEDIKQAADTVAGQRITRKKADIAPTQLQHVYGTKRGFFDDKVPIWFPGRPADSPVFAKSKGLYTYIEKNKSLDTQKIQNDRLTEYLKREQATDRSMREVIADLKGNGYTQGLCNQLVLSTFFGGVEVSESHLSFAFETSQLSYLSTSQKLNSVVDDTTFSDITKSLEVHVKDPSVHTVEFAQALTDAKASR
jgi:hypothetical protein